jgi:cell division protease FtsH
MMVSKDLLSGALSWLLTKPKSPSCGGLTAEQLLKIAIHEAGHVAASCVLGRGRLIVQASMLPYADGGYGIVENRLDPNSGISSRRDLESQIAIKLAGRAAEEVVFGRDEVSVGCGNDLGMATEIAEKMVAWWGFGESSGLASRKLEEIRTCPDARIDVRRILDERYKASLHLVETHLEQVCLVAERLLNEKVVDGDTLRAHFI